MGYEQPIVKPPAEYKGDFFKGEPSDVSNVGVLTNRITLSVSFAEK